MAADPNCPTFSLVLSIFKGENFVVKGSSGCRAFLRARCLDLKPDLPLETGTTKLTSSWTEPEFNSQLAWSLSRKQLKDLRSNRSTIRVSCITVDERTGGENEVGYVVMHIKDASSFGAGVDVDPTKARMYPLLGTKDSWRSLQPKLQMILHLEDIVTKESNNNNKQKAPSKQPSTEHVKNNEKVDNPVRVREAAMKLSETRMQQNVDPECKFLWTVHENDGYFQLGAPAEQDDLYILNTTVISASYLHKLWDGRSPRKKTDEYFWQIRYTAYGCEIASEPFLLSVEDSSRRTFIGDKATARIRASGRLFYEYLRETSMEFHVVRYTLGANNEYINEQVMGFCFLSLAELSHPDVQEYKACMDVVSEWGTSKAVSSHEKPEVRVMFSLESVPNFFSMYQPSDGNAVENQERRSGIADEDDQVDGEGRSQGRPRVKLPRGSAEVQNDEVLPESPEINVVDNGGNNSNIRRLLEFEVGNHDDGVNSGQVETLVPPAKKRGSDTHSVTTEQRQNLRGEDSSSAESEDSDSTSTDNKENLAEIIPEPGKYDVVVHLKSFWLKSSKLLEENFLVSYLHHPIGIVEPVDSIAEPYRSAKITETRQSFKLEKPEFSKSITIRRFPEVLLNEPLTVEFSKMSNGDRKCFGNSMVPFGQIFLKGKNSHGQRSFIDSVDILKTNNNSKIGVLFFDIRLSPTPIVGSGTHKESTKKQSAFFPPSLPREMGEVLGNKFNSPEKYVNQIDKCTNEMREWTKTQEEIYRKQKEEKDAAYIKILSEESAKREAEREKHLSKKLSELERKEKDLNKQRRQMNEREDKLNKLELEIKDRLRALTVENDNFQQHADMNMRRMEESHKITLESCNRRLETYQEDNEKLRRKIVLLEQKLEAKNAEIDNLFDQKRGQPDTRLVARVSILEEENKSLKSQLKEANTRKEQYKKQSMALGQKLSEYYEKRDKEMLDANENLRLQILATKEHKELKKERKTVSEISQAIKALKKETVRPQNGEGDQLGGCSNYPKDDEIRRLQAERNRLLQTGAYTPFDMVIKELEKKMISVSLAQSHQ